MTDAQWITTQGPGILAGCARDIEAIARLVGDLAHEPEPSPPPARQDKVIDLMEALKRSLAHHHKAGA